MAPVGYPIVIKIAHVFILSVLTYLLTYLLTYSLTHSLTHSMVQDII